MAPPSRDSLCPAGLYLQWGTGCGNGHRLDGQPSSGALDKVDLLSEWLRAPVACVWPAGHRLPIQESEKQVSSSDLLSPSRNPLQELRQVSNLLHVPELRGQMVSTQRGLEAWVLLHSPRHAPIPVTVICPQMCMVPRWRNAPFRPQLPLCPHLCICYYNQPHAQCAFKLGMAAHTYGPSTQEEAETEGLQNR